MKTTASLIAISVWAVATAASSQEKLQRNLEMCLSGKYPALCNHSTMIWLPVSEVLVCGTKMINVDDGESVNVARLAPGPSPSVPASQSAVRGYVIQASANDETFVINGEVFKAKTYCFNFNKGDRVIFISGSPSGACASARLLNVRTDRTCAVWCE